MTTEEIFIKEKQLVIARLEASSSDLYFYQGADNKAYSRDEMIELIKNETEIGKEFIKTQLEFLKAFKTGEIQAQLAAI